MKGFFRLVGLFLGKICRYSFPLTFGFLLSSDAAAAACMPKLTEAENWIASNSGHLESLAYPNVQVGFIYHQNGMCEFRVLSNSGNASHVIVSEFFSESDSVEATTETKSRLFSHRGCATNEASQITEFSISSGMVFRVFREERSFIDGECLVGAGEFGRLDRSTSVSNANLSNVSISYYLERKK